MCMRMNRERSPPGVQQSGRLPMLRHLSTVIAATLRLACLVLALALLVTDAVTSELAAPSPAVKKKCGAEIRSLCLRPWRLTPNSIANCVAENRSDLSPACQSFWDTAHSCQIEMKTICGGLFPLTIRSCLTNSRTQFSELCQEVLDLH